MPYLVTGWHDQEAEGRWTSKEATLEFSLETENIHTIMIECVSYQGSGDTNVYLNEYLVGKVKNNPLVHVEKFEIPNDILLKGQTNIIRIETPDATAPSVFEKKDDTRQLGIKIINMKFTE